MFFLSSSPLVLDSPNLQYLYYFGIVTSGKSESDSSSKSGNSYSELVESKIHSFNRDTFCFFVFVFWGQKMKMEKFVQIMYFRGRQHLIAYIFWVTNNSFKVHTVSFFNILNFK